MQSREQWAIILKRLRESNETVILAAVSNLQTIFTHDTITLIAPNKTTFDILNKYAVKLAPALIKLKTTETQQLTIEQKLKNLFGDKYGEN